MCRKYWSQTTKHVGILCGMLLQLIVFYRWIGGIGVCWGRKHRFDFQENHFDIANYQQILKQFVADSWIWFCFSQRKPRKAKNCRRNRNSWRLWRTLRNGIEWTMCAIRAEMLLAFAIRDRISLSNGFEAMMELLPIQRICIPYQRDYPIVASQLNALKPVAEKSGCINFGIPGCRCRWNWTKLRSIVPKTALMLHHLVSGKSR